MGVDFNNGGMSYPRYNNLITAIAECFKGVPSINIPKDTDKVFYAFGYMDTDKKENFIFNDEAPECIKKLCNNPYGDLSDEDVLSLYYILDCSKENIFVVNENDYSTINQFIYELKSCIDCDDTWYIG